MAELSLSVTVSRTLLGQGDLELNDHVTYYVATQFLGAQVQWQRQQVTSPFIDGAVTVTRYREMVTEQLAIEIISDTGPNLKLAVDALIDAFLQDDFTLTVIADSATYAYRCESADYQLLWQGPRSIARQAQVLLNVPRQPAALAGTA